MNGGNTEHKLLLSAFGTTSQDVSAHIDIKIETPNETSLLKSTVTTCGTTSPASMEDGDQMIQDTRVVHVTKKNRH